MTDSTHRLVVCSSNPPAQLQWLDDNTQVVRSAGRYSEPGLPGPAETVGDRYWLSGPDSNSW